MTLGKRIAALAGVFVMAAAVVIVGPVRPATADDYPGQDQIEAARAAANDLAAGVDELDHAIAALSAARDEATANALHAAEDYVQAQEASDQAQTTLAAADKRAEEAEAALAEARQNLASVAQAAYRDAGSMSQMGAVVGATSVDEVIARSEAFARGSDEADMWVQRVQAAELVATTMRGYAEDAATEAEAARVEAEAAYASAADAQAHAEQAVALAEATRSDAIERLAELRGVTRELEEQRQAGLEEERQRLAREEAEREQAEAEREWEANNPAPTPTQTSAPRPSASATSTPTTPAPEATTPAPEATTPAPAPTTTSPAPEPEVTTPAPEPEETTPAPAPTTPAPEPEPTTPAPAPTTTSPAPQPTTTTPAPEPTTPPSTSWRSTAAQGQAAAAYALTLVGKPYRLGSAGPEYYDCSGVSSASWTAAGHWITRSSRSQYQAVTHLPYSQLRPGDLVFYGSNKNNPSSIFHVAVYIGNGQVMEAVNPGKPAGVRGLYAWMSSSLMPYIGRP
ncbi:C40 family peptidase [Demequina pelophila]|uniref:C40 family peptidase n=1 Tax=Demequina pelophila TaxID=1638984 RepID=UPI000781E377|nr:NlpC/P60 family protein [Demequina pelophila]